VTAPEEFSVIGGGLAGPLVAAYLGRRQRRVTLYEMRSDPRSGPPGGGRSINLALSLRGMTALGEVGVLDQVRETGIPMKGRMMHGVDRSLHFQPYGTKAEHVLYSVSRGRLNQLLIDAAAALPGVDVRFDHKCLDVDLDARSGRFATPQGETAVDLGAVVGADGAFSRVRAALQRGDRFDFRQDYLEYGYKELEMPPRHGDFALEPNALHIWPRRSFMLIALPNQDRTFTCTMFWPFEGPVSVASLSDGGRALEFFSRVFPDVPDHIPDLAAQFDRNPVGTLVTVRCRPWQVGDRAVLVGDACHAVVPFYGQGMNAAFEDCTVLNACLGETPDLASAFTRYEERRKRHVDALADLALHNFVEMRDHTGSRAFLLRKTTERWLARVFPRHYIPLYTMISFTRIPYADARRRARRQDRVAAVAAAGVLLVLFVIVLALVL